MNDENLLALELTHLDGYAVLSVQGEIDVVTAPRLQESLQLARELGVPVVLDMALVTFMDSSGLTALIQACRDGNGASSPVRIQSPSEQVRRVLMITGLDEVFPICP